MVGLLIPLILLVAWDFVPDRSLDLVSRQWTGYGGLRLAWRWELLDRLRSLLLLLWAVLGPAGWTAVLIASFIYALGRSENRLHAGADQIALFSLLYIVLHWLVAVPLWDRYFLAPGAARCRCGRHLPVSDSMVRADGRQGVVYARYCPAAASLYVAGGASACRSLFDWWELGW